MFKMQTSPLWLLIAAAVLSSCAKKEDTSKAPPPKPVPVRVAQANQRDVPIELSAIGTVEPYFTVQVKPQVDGQIESVHIRDGQDVKKGDLLYRVDPRQYEALVAQAEATLAKDVVTAEYAEREAKRSAILTSKGQIATEQNEQARATADAARAALKADEAALGNARLKVDYTTITAPLSGRTGEIGVDPGNIVKANDSTLVTIHQIQPIYVTFAVPERSLADVQRYMAADKLKVVVSSSGDSERIAEGFLTFVDNKVDPTAGTIMLKATFENKDSRLWPGAYVNVKLTLSSRPNSILVPTQALQTGQQGQYVFVAKPDSTVDMRSIVIGDAIDTQTVVVKGIDRGETVVTDGQLRLLPGSKITVEANDAGSGGRGSGKPGKRDSATSHVTEGKHIEVAAKP